ncbi:UNVERIFIED_CONTAM: hypothetical protein Sangu_3147500 [Sesamum angustifolium]|uniref:SWIM-type domain-containing protein n=1 Tax=Sesamum angustifolium TaxID=2727405 RepID=A0AAW2K0R8_9LAMI
MTRLQQSRDRAANRWKGKICPRIKKILQKNGDKGSSDCIPIKANDIHYEISCFDGSRCTVDLQRHTCSCRRWDLSGIPCKHAMSTINSQRLDAEDFIVECYSVATYLRVYQPCIMPVNGPEKWQHTDLPPLLPPNIARGVGRPARARRLEPDEVPLKHKGSRVRKSQ